MKSYKSSLVVALGLFGIFAFAGCGKSGLMGLRINNFSKDVSCPAGPQGQVPDLTNLVNSFYSQRGALLDQDCRGTTNNYIQQLVPFLRQQTGDYRIGYNQDWAARDTITYSWDVSPCDGSTNVTTIDVVGGFSTCQNHPQWTVSQDFNARWTLQLPPNSGTGPTGTSGGTSGGGGGTPQMPNVFPTIQQVDAENPGLIGSDCVAFQAKVIERLRQSDPTWGYCNKSYKTPPDIIMYGPGGPLVDFQANSCVPGAYVAWQPLAPNPDCVWGTASTH